ncbi:MAG: PD40 domain-containing protein [Gemmatimonadaceae bacterium]|nr:PD40 domain-containing protein [Gemmatimonadaceae bacterium]
MKRLALAAIVLPGAAAIAQSGPLARAAWLAGCWELRAPDRVTLEMWMPPLGDLMLGASRTTVGAATSEYEHLRLKVERDRLIYTAVPSGQREASFTSTALSDSLLVFENPAHDFPQRIIYRRRGADSMVARIEGPGPGGPRAVQFPYRRTGCLTATPPSPPDTIVMGADLSPDRTRYLIARGAAPAIDVFLADASGALLRRLTDHPHFDYQPRWAPDGRRLAYVSVRGNRHVICTMNADGTGARALTDSSAQNSEPAWSPDGRLIAYRSERDGNANVYVMGADGSGQRALTTDPRAEGGPAWSPDGKRLLFSAVVNGRSEVFVMNADGSGQRQLTRSGNGHSRTALWSPDGARIAFSTNRDGNDEVYVMAADGSGARNLSNHPSADLPVAWSSDGRAIVFVSTRDRPGRDLYRLALEGGGVTRITTTR